MDLIEYFNDNKHLLSNLARANLSLDGFFVLLCKEYANDNLLLAFKVRSEVYDTLIECGLISRDRKLLSKGKELLYQVLDPHVNNVEVLASFDAFWEMYPASTSVEINGVKYPKTRALKTVNSKVVCKKLFFIALKKVSKEQVLAVLQDEIEERVRRTIDTGENQFQYMKNMLNWLKDELYITDTVVISQQNRGQDEAL